MTFQDRFRATHEGRQIDARGYIMDEAYINRFFDLQSPSRMTYSLRCAGYDVPSVPKTFRYCDLGCGYGLTVLILARCHPKAKFVGIDINPEHIAWANAMARRFKLKNVSFVCADFGEVGSEDEPYDYIAAHGIYTWVDPSVQAALFNFVERNLAEKGLFYVSYNAYPGWGAKESLWHIINRYTDGMSGNSVERTREAMAFLEMLGNEEVDYIEENPIAQGQFEYLKTEDLRYVAHEYCNQNFRPIYASQAFAQAKTYGLHFMAQAETLYSIPKWNEPRFLDGLLASLNAPEDREIWVSLLRNDDFRSDIYARTPLRKTTIDRTRIWDMSVAAVHPIEDVDQELSEGPVTIDTEEPLMATLLHAARRPGQTLRSLCQHPDLIATSPALILEAAQLLELEEVIRLVEPGALGQVLDPDVPWQFADPMTSVLLADALKTGNVCYLPAPGFASAIHVEPMLAHACLALASKKPVKTFQTALNVTAPHLMDYPVNLTWCETYLEQVKERWAGIFGTGRVFVEK